MTQILENGALEDNDRLTWNNSSEIDLNVHAHPTNDNNIYSNHQESYIRGAAHAFATKLAKFESEVWESLAFPVMADREHEIVDAELETFNWVFKEPRSEERPWSNFLEWLQTGGGLYWMSGKAGSGRSTLMKHLSTID